MFEIDPIDTSSSAQPSTPSLDVKIIPYHNNTMKIIYNDKYFILEPNRYNINALMMLIDIKKINKIEERFLQTPDGLDRLTFIKLLRQELPTNPSDPYDEINMVYGLYKLFCEIDLSGDKCMQWSEFTQFIIDRVEGEDDSSDPNDMKSAKEKEMLKYKRYMISEKVKDYNIHKKDVITGVFHQKIDKLLVSEYDSKIIKVYNPRSGKCDLNFDIENYFQQKMIEEEKERKGITSKKQKFNIELVKSLTFSVLSMCISPMNIVAVCLSNNKICFFTFTQDLKANCIYEMQTSTLQKRVWYLKEHGVWMSTGRKHDNDRFFHLYELDIEFEKNGNRIECLYNKGHWYRNAFFENPTDPTSPHVNKGHKDEIIDVIEISKPMLVLTACMDGKIRLFNINDKEFIKVWKAHEGGIRSLAFNPHLETNGLILSTGFEYHINIFATDLSLDDAYKGKLEGHFAPVVSVTFLSDSYMCASVDEDAVVKIWDTRIRQCLQSISCDKKNIVVNRLLYMKKYNRFVIYGSKMIFYDPKYTESEINRQTREQSAINYPIQCEFNNYYMQFYVSTMKDLRIYSAVNGQLVSVFKKFIEQERFDNADTKIRTFCFDYRHRLIYFGFSNGTVQQFNAGNASLIKPINEFEIEKDGITTIKTHHTKDVTSMFVFYNNPEVQENADFILVTTSLDSLVNMYNENDPETSTKLRGIRNSHKIGDKVNEILCMDFSRRYNKFATGSIDGLVVVWDFELTKMEDLYYVKSYRPGSFNAMLVKFIDPFPVLVVAYSNSDLYFWGVKPSSRYRGECFFRCKNYLIKESGFFPVQVTSMMFLYHDNINIAATTTSMHVQHEKEFNMHLPKDIEIDDDIYHNNALRVNSEHPKHKAYLILGDQKGWLKCIDVLPVLNKFKMEICDESKIQSSLNIMKKEEINAESSLMFNYQKDKEFICGFTSLYCNLIHYENHIHNDEVTYLSLVQEPISFISVSKDQHVKIWSLSMEILGEFYTGANTDEVCLAEWKFNVNWEKLKKTEMEEFLNEIVNEIDMDMSFLLPAKKSDYLPPSSSHDDDGGVRKDEPHIQSPIEIIQSELFKTNVPKIKKKRFKKIELKKEGGNRYDDDNRINESYEGRFIQDMKRKIDDMFVKQGEEVGMNEMSKNVIDNVVGGKDIMELFQPPTLNANANVPLMKKANSQSMKMLLPKVNVNGKERDERKELFSEKFIKKVDDNVRDTLILPLIKHEFKSNENVKFKQGETEKILSFEYYTNSYKACCRIKQGLEPIEALRKNYKLMWNFVDGYRKNKGGKDRDRKMKRNKSSV